MSTQAARKDGGFVLVAGIFLVLLLGALALGLVEEGRAARSLVSLHESNLRALEIAEIGLIRAEMEIRAQVDSGTDGIGAVSGEAAGGTFEVEVRDDPVSNQRWVLTATGRHGFSVRRVEIGVRRWRDVMFAEALFSLDDLELSNTTTDAYDSRLGSYASQRLSSDAAGSFAEMGGSVGSNGDVYLDGTAVWVRGDAVPGPFRETYLSGSPTVLGDMMPRQFEMPVDIPTEDQFREAMLHNDNAHIQSLGPGNTVRYNARTFTLDVAGGTHAVLPGGTYFFEDVFLRGGSTLEFSGPTEIYVTGSFDVAAGTNILAARPADLRVYAHPYDITGRPNAGTTIKVSGGSSVTWALHAPQADLVLGGGNDFYGASVAKHVDISGTNAFHYDKALGMVGVEGVAHMERLFWREIGRPRR